MKKLSGGKRTSYHVLGVPSFANAREIRAAYLKRIEVLGAYRFDKAKQPMEWQVVEDVLRELNEAYAQLTSPNPSRNDGSKLNGEGEASAFHHVTTV